MSSDLDGLVKGLHHITLVTSNQEINRRFYTEILGLRRVKLSVNQDDIYHRHIFFADDKGTTGSAITFFEWPELPRGQIGLGSPHHLAYNVPGFSSLPKWKVWLASKGVDVDGPYRRGSNRVSLYLRDPDGVIVELTAENTEGLSDDYVRESFSEKSIESLRPELTWDMKLTVFNHASPLTSDPSLTTRFMKKLLGLSHSSTVPNPDQKDTSIVAIGNSNEEDFLSYISTPNAPDGSVGKGNIHHIAMSVEENQDQERIMRKLNEGGFRNSGLVDRFWFRSLYFRDPDGNLLEIATKKPGYTADEPLDKLGTSLVLPAWLEPKRSEIEQALNETDTKNRLTWPPEYPRVKTPPESVVSAS